MSLRVYGLSQTLPCIWSLVPCIHVSLSILDWVADCYLITPMYLREEFGSKHLRLSEAKEGLQVLMPWPGPRLCWRLCVILRIVQDSGFAENQVLFPVLPLKHSLCLGESLSHLRAVDTLPFLCKTL